MSKTTSAPSSSTQPTGILDWEGGLNVRDLGGLRTQDGRRTRFGALVRSGTPDELTPAGWAALWSHGVRTIVDLRDPTETLDGASGRPDKLTTIRIQLEDYAADVEFWQQWRETGMWATPLYYAAFIRRWPERCAAVVSAVARAAPGGVLFHCGRGRDRTGLIAMVLLTLAGVEPSEIAADYEASTSALRPRFHEECDKIDALLARYRTSPRAAIIDALAGMDIASELRTGGLRNDDVEALRDRVIAIE